MSEIRCAEWIDVPGGWKCSLCGQIDERNHYYCPNCGAKMVNFYPMEENGKRKQIIEVLEQMETAMERLGGTRAEIWQNDVIYCLCRAVWLMMTWELKKL